MKITPRETDKFIEAGYTRFGATLIYGPDYGLISERAKQIISNSQKQNYDPNFNFLKLDFKEANSSPDIIANEINSIPFNRHHKIIHMTHAGSVIGKELIELLEANSYAIIVISAGELPPAASLRKTFENSKKLACLACYHDDLVSIKQFIHKCLRENGYSYDTQIVDFLALRLGNDRLIATHEIEKILLYFAKSKKITYEELINFYTETNSELSVDNFIHYWVSGKTSPAINELQQILSMDKNHIAVVRQITSFFQKIRLIKSFFEEGKAEQDVFSQIKPPIFYKNVPFYRLAAKKLSMMQVDNMIKKLIKLEIDCKSIYINQGVLLDKFIIDNPF